MKRCTTSNPYLPEELVWNILLRLSVKMLLRCKLVCKQWCSLVECPTFVEQHYSHCSNPERLLFRVGSFEEAFRGLKEAMKDDEDYDAPILMRCKYALPVDETYSKFEKPYHLQMPDSVSDLIGPLNGVYCVVSYGWPFGLLNPATRQFKPLPSFELPGLRRHEFEVGFGLDPLTGDFKLVLVSFYYSCVAVCTDSWRFLKEVKLSRRVLGSVCNTYLNGVYYWLLDYHGNRDVGVLAFDMRTEELKEIHVMSGDDNNKWVWGFLAASGDGYSMYLIMQRLDGCVDVCKMVNGWWLRIRSSNLFPIHNFIGVRPVYLWKNNELLLEVLKPAARRRRAEVVFFYKDDKLLFKEPCEEDAFLVSYNLRGQQLGSFRVKRCDEWTQHHWFFGYKESLVSLKGNCKLWDPTSHYIKDFFKTHKKRESLY